MRVPTDPASGLATSDHRDVVAVPAAVSGAPGRSVIVAIGIDRYHRWRKLARAVSDARGARALFHRLGFEDAVPPIYDDRATGQALHALVTDELTALGHDDRLVVFFAGHGGTRIQNVGEEQVKLGYLIPVDAARARNKVSTWIDLGDWLRRIAVLPPRHILVIIDACYSGIALDPVFRWRDDLSLEDTPLAALQARRSRRVITSALDDQRALDSGPVHGHSLFTGCLIEGLTGGMASVGGVTTGSAIGLWVQERVRTYPRSRQTPDFGAFDFDDRGEMPIPLSAPPNPFGTATAPALAALPSSTIADPAGSPGDGHAARRAPATVPVGATPTWPPAHRSSLVWLLRSVVRRDRIWIPLGIVFWIAFLIAARCVN